MDELTPGSDATAAAKGPRRASRSVRLALARAVVVVLGLLGVVVAWALRGTSLFDDDVELIPLAVSSETMLFPRGATVITGSGPERRVSWAPPDVDRRCRVLA